MHCNHSANTHNPPSPAQLVHPSPSLLRGSCEEHLQSLEELKDSTSGYLASPPPVEERSSEEPQGEGEGDAAELVATANPTTQQCNLLLVLHLIPFLNTAMHFKP